MLGSGGLAVIATVSNAAARSNPSVLLIMLMLEAIEDFINEAFCFENSCGIES